MPFETIPIPLARSGLNKDIDPVSLKGVYSPNMQNMVVEALRLRKRLGFSKSGLNLPLSGIGSELLQYLDHRGSIHQIALTSTNAFQHEADSDMWVPITPSVDLDECEAGWTKGQAADTAEHDTAEFIRGAKSLKITLGAERSDGDQLAYKDISSVNITAQNVGENEALILTHIGFWIKASTNLAANAVEIVVSESNHGSGEKTGTYVESLSTALTADIWTFVQLAKTLTDYNAVISVSVYANATLASGLIIYVDDIRAYCPFTGAVDDRWSHSEAHDSNYFSNNGGTALCISNGVDSIRFFEGQSDDVFQKLDVSTFANFVQTKEIVEFWNHFFAFDFTDTARNVRSYIYTDFADIVDWVNGTSGSGVLTDSRGKLMRAKKLGSDLIIYSEKAITTGRYLGAAALFAFPTLVYETGLFAPKAIWDFVNIHYFVGADLRIYGYPGGRHLVHIGRPIEDSMFAEMDISKKLKMVAGIDTGRHKLHFFHAVTGDTYAKRSYAVDYKRPDLPWEYHKFGKDVRDLSVFDNTREWYCDDADKTDLYCDEVDFYCDESYGQSGYAVSIFIDSDGYVYKMDDIDGYDDDVAVEAIYDTEDVTIKLQAHYGRYAWFDFDAKADIANSTVSVYYSIDGGTTWTEFADSPVSLTTAWDVKRLPLDTSSRKIRYRLQQSSVGDLKIRGEFHHSVSVEPETD